VSEDAAATLTKAMISARTVEWHLRKVAQMVATGGMLWRD
jgi:hypothetical protein